MKSALLETKSVIRLGQGFEGDFHFSLFEREVDGEIILKVEEDFLSKTRFGSVTIKKGFLSDGASIPRLARKFVGDPFDKQYIVAAVVHDWLYRFGIDSPFSRSQADTVFRDLLWNTKVPIWKVPVFYSAVATFGGRSYKKEKYKL